MPREFHEGVYSPTCKSAEVAGDDETMTLWYAAPQLIRFASIRAPHQTLSLCRIGNARLLCSNSESHRNPTSREPQGKPHSSPKQPPTETESLADNAYKSHTNGATRDDGLEELKILYDATLRHVSTYGWTDRAIEAAVSELGWSPAAKRMIAKGPVQLVEEFVSRCNWQLAETLAVENEKHSAAAGGTDPVGRATFAMRERLEMIEPYHHNWARALSLQASPQNAPAALKSAALLTDEIAHYAGYRTTDMSWYTDRAVLGVVYHSAQLHWLTDKSPNRTHTWRFIENRLRDSHSLRSRITSTYDNVMTLSDAAVGSLRSIARAARRSY